MRPGLPFSTRCFRARISGLGTVGAALVVVAGLTVTAVSSAAASGTPPRPGPSGHGVLRVTGNPASPGALPGSGALAARPQPPLNATVMLPTGDRVRLSAAPDGVQQATPVPATAPGRLRHPATFMRFAWGGDQYVVPDATVPYLHSTLDPRLFDASYLARAHLGTGSAGIPAHITYTSPAAAASLPGVRVIHRSGVTATATINPVQATRLGQFLAAQWRAAYARHSPVPVGRLPGIAKITLAPPRGAPPLPASPARAPVRSGAAARGLPFYTLTLKATDLNGKPGTFGGFVQNVGNASLFDQSSCVFIAFSCGASTGAESLSVPRGTYSLAISVVTPDSSGGFTTALVVKPQVTVHSDTTVTLDARTAVPYSVHLHTVASATERVDTLSFSRTSASGGGDGPIGYPSAFPYGLDTISPNPLPPFFAGALRATPTAPVTEGSFLFDASTQFCGGFSLEQFSCLGPGPQYLLDFPDRGSIPPSLTYTVPPAALTTVHSQMYQSPVPDCVPPAGQHLLMETNVYLSVAPGAWAFISSPILTALAPGTRTGYWYSGNPRLDLWQPQVFAAATGCSAQYGQPRVIHRGQQLTGVWNKAPLVPGLNAAPYIFAATRTYSGDPRRTVCTACRQGDIGAVNILMGADSDPAHYNDGGCGSPPLEFYRNGILALDSATEFVARCPFGLELPLLHRAATYRLDASGQISPDPAATTETGWTFHSSPADPAASLPTTETCAPDATRSCSFLPLLFIRYDLPLNYHGQATAGSPEPVRFTVTGQQDAPAPSGLSATVSASFDGGQTWTTPQAAASLGSGRFTTTISQPPLASTDGFVALRVTAHDGAGDSVTQTITRAYGLTS